MKAKYLLIVFMASIFMGLFSCSTTRVEKNRKHSYKERSIYSGHSKRASDSKSDRHHAPGHHH